MRSPQDLFSVIKQEYPYLNVLLASSAQVWEMETIEDHVRKVLAIAQIVKAAYQIDELPEEDARLVNVKGLMNVLLLMHDIGKGLGRKVDQYELHKPVVTHFLKAWGYSEFEVKRATELLMSDAVGLMIQGKVGIKDTFASLRRKAARANVSLNTFVRLHMLYYSADAGSYDSVRAAVFSSRPGALFFPLFVIDHAVEIFEELKK